MRHVFYGFVFLVSVVHGLSCTCGLVASPDEFSSNIYCFTPDIEITPYCTASRVHVNNTESLPTSCSGSLVGLLLANCTGWFQWPDKDGVTLDIWLCNMEQVSFGRCLPTQVNDPHGFPVRLQPIQFESDTFDPLWASDSQCLTSLCPESLIVTPFMPSDPYITFRNGSYYSVCNRVYDRQNICNSSAAACTCHVYQDTSQSFTGNACQFEKGRGECCTLSNLAPGLCCPASTPYGSCSTAPSNLMCGVSSVSRSSFCISADGVRPPTCEVQAIVNNTFTFVPHCPEGLTCPRATNLPSDSRCRAPSIENQPCACQCSLCPDPGCNGFGSLGPRFGQCRTTPSVGCSCVVPGSPCQDSATNNCNTVAPCTASDLCGGPVCDQRINQCRTLAACDTSQLWRYNVTHPCVCYGRGLCNFDLRACECFDANGEFLQAPLYSNLTRCAALDSCEHCNTNPTLPLASVCAQTVAFPNAFNCTCRRYWYTSGSFQNIGTSKSTPIFQCSTGSCMGAYSTLPLPLNTTDGWQTADYLFINTTTGLCQCPNGTLNYLDPPTRREYCIMTPFLSPSGVPCGHGNFNFIELKVVPPLPGFVATSNTQLYTQADLPRATLFSMGGTPRCTCDAFTNATYPIRGMWTYSANLTYCEPWCNPPFVNFVIDTVGKLTRRTCTNCFEFGYATVTNPLTGDSRCGGPVCQNGAMWNQTAERCNCDNTYPYIYNFPPSINVNCSLSWCYPFGPLNGDNICICPPAYEPSPFPTTFPSPVAGCVSNCTTGVPNPATGYTTCICPQPYITGPLCENVPCLNDGVPNPNTANGICICPPIYNGSQCENLLCQHGTPHLPGNKFCDCFTWWTGFLCNETLCSAYTNSALRDPTPLFLYRNSSTNEERTLVYAGLPDPPNPPSNSPTSCQCSPKYSNTATLWGVPACNNRICKQDQDAVANQDFPDTINFCRCTCPSILTGVGTYNVAPNGMAGCSISSFPAGFRSSSHGLPCPGYLPNAGHDGWEAQCLPQFSGFNCTQPACTGHFVYSSLANACICANLWTPQPPAAGACLTCAITGNVDLVTCACIGNFVLQGTVCTDLTCDPTNPACNTPTVPDFNDSVESGSTSDWPWWAWFLIAIVSAGIIVTIALVAWICTKPPVPKTTSGDAASTPAEQQQQQQQGIGATPATTSESAPLMSSTVAPLELVPMQSQPPPLQTVDAPPQDTITPLGDESLGEGVPAGGRRKRNKRHDPPIDPFLTSMRNSAF